MFLIQLFCLNHKSVQQFGVRRSTQLKRNTHSIAWQNAMNLFKKNKTSFKIEQMRRRHVPFRKSSPLTALLKFLRPKPAVFLRTSNFKNRFLFFTTQRFGSSRKHSSALTNFPSCLEKHCKPASPIARGIIVINPLFFFFELTLNKSFCK
jgi:hypothetical protein